MASGNNQPVYQDREEEEIQLGSLWARGKSSIRYLIRKWYWMMLGITIFIGLGIGYSIWYGKKYIATSTFSVQGQSAQSALLSSAMSLASSLGLSTGGGKGGGYDNNFFANLMQSRRVVMQSLLQEGTMDGKKDLMANHYITLYRWRQGSLIHKGWNKIPRMKDFKFTHTDVNQLSPLEDSIMHVIYQDIIDNNLVVTFDETQPFNDATFTTRNADFSRQMLKIMLDKTSKFYMDNIYELDIQSFKIADYRVDSIGNALKNLDYTVANLRDVTNNLVKQKGYLDLNAAIRNQNLMNIQYSSAVNNVELAKVTLLANAPVLQVVDDPLFSTELSFVSKVTASIVTGLLGFFLTAGILLLGKVVRDSDEKEKRKEEPSNQQEENVTAS